MTRPMARSATSSVSTSGVLVTLNPRAVRLREVDLVEADAVDGDDLERRQLGGELVRKAQMAAGDHGTDRRPVGAEQGLGRRRPRTSGAR